MGKFDAPRAFDAPSTSSASGPDYIALTPILQDGKTVLPGAPLSLTETEAAPLIRLKAVELEAVPAKKPSPKPKPSDVLGTSNAQNSEGTL